MYIKFVVEAFCMAQDVDPKLAVVGAGTAMYLHGLRKGWSDIDMYHPALAEQKVSFMGHEIDVGGLNRDGSLWKGEVKNGLRIQTKNELRAFYKMLGRPKDQASLLLLQE